MKTYLQHLNENNPPPLAGAGAFEIFLEIIDEFGQEFTKTNYLNTGEYAYFFTTEPLAGNQEVLRRLELKTSLATAYSTLYTIQQARVSFYLGVKGFRLEYGFFDDNKRLVYKVGMFKINNRYLQKLDHRDCFNLVRGVFQRTNLQHLQVLHQVKTDMVAFWPALNGTREILDERRLKLTFKAEYFKAEDLDETKLVATLEQWARAQKWSAKFYYYGQLTPKYIHLYLKLREEEIYHYNL